MNNPVELMFLDLQNVTVDLRRVTHVEGVGGDANWLRYSVHIDSGKMLEVYETCSFREGYSLNQMPRAEFVKRWQNALIGPASSDEQKAAPQVVEMNPLVVACEKIGTDHYRITLATGQSYRIFSMQEPELGKPAPFA